MSSQNSRCGHLVPVPRAANERETRVWNFMQLTGDYALNFLNFVRLVCLASANFLPPSRTAIGLQNLFA
jgi:hypothetical protein